MLSYVSLFIVVDIEGVFSVFYNFCIFAIFVLFGFCMEANFIVLFGGGKMRGFFEGKFLSCKY